jgi:hypothetical protein
MADGGYKKMTKEYLVTDSTLNCYKYRLLTTGYLMDRYQKNPIGFYMHGTPEFPREAGVLIRWVDFRVDQDRVYATPCINLSHPRGERTVVEIENGFLNAASVGRIIALEFSEKPHDYLPGQTGPTVSKWYNQEISLVDIPGNYNALSELFDANNNPLNLLNLSHKYNKFTMKPITLNTEQMGLLNLRDDSDAAAVSAALNDLISKAARASNLEKELVAAKQAKSTSDAELVDFKKKGVEQQVKDLVDTAIKEKKLSVKTGAQLAVQYAENPDGLKELIDNLPVYVSFNGMIGQQTGRVDELVAKGWDELDRQGLLPELKATDLNAFKELFKKRFNKEYTVRASSR